MISGLKKLRENQKAANQEMDLVSLFEIRFNELEKKIDDTQTSMKEIKKSGELIKQDIKSSTKENYAGIVMSTENPIIPDFRKILCDEKLGRLTRKGNKNCAYQISWYLTVMKTVKLVIVNSCVN